VNKFRYGNLTSQFLWIVSFIEQLLPWLILSTSTSLIRKVVGGDKLPKFKTGNLYGTYWANAAALAMLTTPSH
jgi:hypothetical protein